ncbi:MAG: 50S ribosomal protein L15 [Patescibacteria group bacterium]|nr:50S ribosomal protein L15 [Patescibacteria group bacterium]
MLSLNNLQLAKGSKKKSQRRGRGNASRRGNYSGRGMKGQKSRSGGKSGLKKLGMRSMILQMPKLRGFNREGKIIHIVNVGDIEKIFKSGDNINPKELFKKGLIRTSSGIVKILGNGKLTKKFNVSAHQYSQSAKQIIEKTGGVATVFIKKENPKLKKSKKQEQK